MFMLVRQIFWLIVAFTAINLAVLSHPRNYLAVMPFFRPAAPHQALRTPPRPAPQPPLTAEQKKRQAIVHLKNGNALNCLVVRIKETSILIEWGGGKAEFLKSEVRFVDWGGSLEEPTVYRNSTWPFANNPIIHLVNRQTIDGAITAVTPKALMVREQLTRGGYIEYQIPKNRIRALSFDSDRPESAKKIKSELVSRFSLLAEYDNLVRYSREPTQEAALPKKRGRKSFIPHIRIGLPGRLTATVENFFAAKSELEDLLKPAPASS